MPYDQMLIEYSDILLPEDVMEILHIGKSTVYSYLSKGIIRSIRVGKKYRIPKYYLLEYMYPEKQNSI